MFNLKDVIAASSTTVEFPRSDVFGDGCLTDIKQEDEEVNINIEDEDLEEESNSLAHQDNQCYCDRPTFDDIAMTLKKEVKEEGDSFTSNPCMDVAHDSKNILILNSAEPTAPGNKEILHSLKPRGRLKSHKSSSVILKTRKPHYTKKFKTGPISLFDPRDRMYHCDHCRYKAKNAQSMEYHRSTHTGEKPYECKFCDYKAGHPTTLRRHTRCHTGEKPHVCKHCDYRAAQPTALLNHLRSMHTGERPYTCDVCPFTAHDQGTMAGHKLTHLPPDEKPFECSVCGVKMARKTHLRRHAKSKHPGTNVCLERRLDSVRNNRQFSMKQPTIKRSKFKKKWESSDSWTSTSEDEILLPVENSFVHPDQEYRPDKCVTLGFQAPRDRPRRSIVAPKKLDL